MTSYFRLGVTLLAGTCSTYVLAQGTPDIIWERPGASAYTIDFSPDEQTIATGGVGDQNPYVNGQFKFWQTSDGTNFYTTTREPSGAQLGFVNEIVFSPDGTRVATANGAVDCAPKGGCFSVGPGQFVWAFPAGQNIAGSERGNIVAGIDWAPNGQLIATAEYYNGPQVYIYDSNFTLVRSLPGHPGGSLSVRFSPNGTMLASSGFDQTVKIWDVATGTMLRQIALEGSGAYLSFSPQGDFLAVSDQGSADTYNQSVKVYRVSDWQLVRTLPGSAYGTTIGVFSPDGQTIGAAITQYTSGIGWHGRLRFWRASDGSLIREYVETRLGGAGIQTLMFAPDSTEFAYAYGSHLILARTPTSGTNVGPASFTMARGMVLSGGLSDLINSDDNRLVVRPGIVFSAAEAPVQIDLVATSPLGSPAGMQFKLEAQSSSTNLNQKIELFNYTTSSFEQVDSRASTTGDSVVNVSVSGNVSRFVNAVTHEMRARVSYRAVAPVFNYPWQARLDQVQWAIN